MPGVLTRLRDALRPARRTPRVVTTDASTEDALAFECNLCGADNVTARSLLQRELPSCRQCGSTVRFRAIGHLVVREVLGGEAPLTAVASHRRIRGIGLSDADAYAAPLRRRFDYTNTFFHAEPRLDITDVPDALAGRHRFVIASDVFEHVAPPVARAFIGARKLLAPGGVLILTVPFALEGDTVEHFSDLHRFRIDDAAGRPVLHNTTRDGREQRFGDLVFHGGDGATLEMRLFSRDGIVRELEAAGFSQVRFCGEPCERFGIVWPEPWSIPIVARP